MKHSFGKKLLDRCFGKSVDVHGIAADKQGQGFDLFGETIRVFAEKHLGVILVVDHSRTAADRTLIRYNEIVTAGKVFCNLRNDHIGFVDADRITDTEGKLADDADIVDAGAAYGSALQLYRLKDGNRVDQTGS